jgi:hypothetical protein
MTVHIPQDRALPNQEAVDLVVALQRCLASFHGQQDKPAVLPPVDEERLAALARYREVRDMRQEIFGRGLFADPIWDMLLTLYEGELAGRPVSVARACKATGLPIRSALQYVEIMDQRGLLLAPSHQQGARRLWLNLSPIAIDAMTSWVQLMFGRSVPQADAP